MTKLHGMDLADAVLAGDEREGGHVEEEAVLDDADDGADVGGVFAGSGMEPPAQSRMTLSSSVM